MDLLLFYISQIFTEGHFPLPAEICAGAESITPMCVTSVSFTLGFTALIALATTFLFVKRFANRFVLVSFSLLSIFSCFVLSDYSMREIEEPVMFGIEWFMLSYNLWILLTLLIYLAIILFPAKRKKLLITELLMTIAAVLFFAYTGRGNFEQITPIAGGLYGKIDFDMLWLSFSFRFFCFLAALAGIFTLCTIIYHWVRTGLVDVSSFKRNLITLCAFFGILILPVFSIRLGEEFNYRDVKEAKSYIDEIRKKVIKYYYENGEYPKFVEDMLPPGKSPRLLERHEFFTMGVRGTYYFSRADKFCFIFQNPTNQFGYYSVTSERDWRYNLKTDSYDDAFVNLCDESEKNFQDLISNHLGVDANDKLINELSLEAGAPVMPKPMTNKASKVLQDKILDQSKKDPSLLKYFKAPETPENKE